MTSKYQKKLMQNIIDKINRITYGRLQLELALYGYVDINGFVKKYPIDSLKEEGAINEAREM